MEKMYILIIRLSHFRTTILFVCFDFYLRTQLREQTIKKENEYNGSSSTLSTSCNFAIKEETRSQAIYSLLGAHKFNATNYSVITDYFSLLIASNVVFSSFVYFIFLIAFIFFATMNVS